MQNDSGIRMLLTIPIIYELSQELIGAHAWRRKFIRENVKPKTGEKIIDIGCGPAQMLDWLPAVNYVGFDVSKPYIEAAKRKYGSRGVFLVGDTKTLRGNPEVQKADIVMCCGVLHHLNDDEAADLIGFAKESLRPGGRFLALETAYLPGQSRISKWMVSKDRGMNVRTEDAYRQLAVDCFPDINIVTDLRPLRIPYAGLVMECAKGQG